MGLPEFARDMRVPVNYRDHVIDSGVLAWVFYERGCRGGIKPAVSLPRRKEARRKAPKRSLDITSCMARDHASGGVRDHARPARRPLSVNRLVSVLTGVLALFMMRPSRGGQGLRGS